jgi:hypothetical protein
MSRLSTLVIQQLLDEMDRLVTDYAYDRGVKRTGRTITDLIDGTACFPGGAGLWRGAVYGGPLPTYFPERCVMFISHNFDSIEAHDEAQRNKGEVKSTYWNNLQDFLYKAGRLDPTGCFFTNALMGLKPEGASGPMPGSKNFKEQCRRYLSRQIEIVMPRAVVTLGDAARDEYRQSLKLQGCGPRMSGAGVMHPSTRPKDQRPDHETWLLIQGCEIRRGIDSTMPFRP